jgi:hypothetical protein
LKKLRFTIIIFTILVLLVGYSLRGQWLGAFSVLGCGLIWLSGHYWNWRWFPPIALIIFIALAAYGVWLEVSIVWMLLAVIGTLAAWDLARFSERLAQTSNSADQAALEQIHLRRLQLTAGLGLLLGAAAMAIQFQLNLVWAVLLSLLMVISLSWSIRLIQRLNEK